MRLCDGIFTVKTRMIKPVGFSHGDTRCDGSGRIKGQRESNPLQVIKFRWFMQHFQKALHGRCKTSAPIGTQ